MGENNNTLLDPARKIPSPIMREVRQDCGFGCVICGTPIYEYDHIDEWSVVKEHKRENIVLLCPNHHSEKTKGLLTPEKIRVHQSKPYNIVNEISNPYLLHFEGTKICMKLGDLKLFHPGNLNLTKDCLYAIVHKQEVLLGFDIIEGNLYLTLKIYDDENNLILWIKENRMEFVNGVWDIEFTGVNLIIRQASRDILFDIDFILPSSIRVNRGTIRYNKSKIEIHKQELRGAGLVFQGQEIHARCAIGI
jgi:hypothetical protein